MTGRPFHLPSLDRMIDAIIDTQREFGSVADDGKELLVGPALDEDTRRIMQLRRFRMQAERAAAETAYYGQMFQELGLDPRALTHEDLAAIPLTPKQAVRERPDEFVRRTARPTFRTTTTGTTGRPTHVLFSEQEMNTYIALGAISNLLARHIGHEDVIQMNTSSRARLGNTCFAFRPRSFR